jgi:hypothetical protein
VMSNVIFGERGSAGLVWKTASLQATTARG